MSIDASGDEEAVAAAARLYRWNGVLSRVLVVESGPATVRLVGAVTRRSSRRRLLLSSVPCGMSRYVIDSVACRGICTYIDISSWNDDNNKNRLTLIGFPLTHPVDWKTKCIRMESKKGYNMICHLDDTWGDVFQFNGSISGQSDQLKFAVIFIYTNQILITRVIQSKQI